MNSSSIPENPLDLSVPVDAFVYETDEAYQALFQKFFQFKDNLEEIGDIYDVEQVRIGMEYIMSKTAEDPWWQKIFVKAASMFLSEEPDLGLCVCLNFSYFDKFYKLFYCAELNLEHPQLAEWRAALEKDLEIVE